MVYSALIISDFFVAFDILSLMKLCFSNSPTGKKKKRRKGKSVRIHIKLITGVNAWQGTKIEDDSYSEITLYFFLQDNVLMYYLY